MNRSSSVSLALLALACLALAPAAHAQSTYFTTGTYTIDAAHSVSQFADVGLNSSGSRTDPMGHPYNPTVNLVPGGSVGTGLQSFNSSRVNITGGSVGGLVSASDSSQIVISAATVSGSVGSTGSGSQLTISGGTFGELDVYGGGVATISGGAFSSYVDAEDHAQVTLSGGAFASFLGVNFYDLTTGSFTFIGSNLAALNVGSDLNFGGTDYLLSGALQDGTSITGDIFNVQSGAGGFTLRSAPAAVPEPGSVALLVGMGISGAGFLLRKRRK